MLTTRIRLSDEMTPSPHDIPDANRPPLPIGQLATDYSQRANTLDRRLALAKRTSPEVVVILLYILVSRLSLGQEARYGLWIGAVPIFPTDVALLLLIILTARHHPAWFKHWILSGKGADPVGRAVWCICILAIVHFTLAFPGYRVFALRDFAMFGYSAFFPLSYWAIRDRKTAVRITHYLVYGSLIVGVPVAIEYLTGWNLGIPIERTALMTTAGLFDRIGVGDLGSNLGFSLAALVAYLILQSGSWSINLGAAAVSIVIIAAQLSRSAVLCVAAAVVLTLLFSKKHRRFALIFFGAAAAIFLMTHSSSISALADAVKSGSAISDDVDFQFRLLRWVSALAVWLAHPILGAGFGVEISPTDPAEIGMFNAGMPHNSYLTIGARTGILGLGLFLFCGGRPLYLLLRRLGHRRLDPQILAVTNILVAMCIFASLNLFLEEPLLIGPFWIMLAVACRLVQFSAPPLNVRRRPIERLPAAGVTT